MGGNQATRVNPFVVNDRAVDIHITVRGSDWYWTVMSTMGFTMLVIMGLSFLKPASSRIFFYILSAVTFVAMIEHYSMASNLGWVPVDVEWQRTDEPIFGINRQIWWVRYCCWFLIWPLMSLALLLTCAAPSVHILWTCFLSCMMAVMALVGAVVRSDYKWGYYGFWIFSWLLLGYCLLWAPRNYARALGRNIQVAHIISSSWIWFLWMLYPVCWGISEGGNLITPDSEFIFYGILDCCLIPITCAVFLALHWGVDPVLLGLYMRTFNDPVDGYQQPVTASGALQEGEKETPDETNISNGRLQGEAGDTTGNQPSDASQMA